MQNSGITKGNEKPELAIAGSYFHLGPEKERRLKGATTSQRQLETQKWATHFSYGHEDKQSLPEP